MTDYKAMYAQLNAQYKSALSENDELEASYKQLVSSKKKYEHKINSLLDILNTLDGAGDAGASNKDVSGDVERLKKVVKERPELKEDLKSLIDEKGFSTQI